MTRRATTTTPDPELSTPLGNEPRPAEERGHRTVPDRAAKPDTEGKPVHEELEVELLEGRQESGRED
jgi:hypothetical protein